MGGGWPFSFRPGSPGRPFWGRPLLRADIGLALRQSPEDMSSHHLYLGVILVIALMLIAYFAWRRWRRRGDHFTYATPATPRVNEAVGELFAALRCMATLGRSFGEQAASSPDLPGLAGAASGVALTTAALGRAEQTLGGAPPTYANYLGVYRGLVSTDRTLLGAAEAYIGAGHGLHQQVALMAAGDPASGPVASLGGTLIAMGAQLRRVVASVHRLGAALDVE